MSTQTLTPTDHTAGYDVNSCVAVDNQGRAIWVSQVFNSATLCGVMDPSCASQRRETFSQQFPDAVGLDART